MEVDEFWRLSIKPPKLSQTPRLLAQAKLGLGLYRF